MAFPLIPFALAGAALYFLARKSAPAEAPAPPAPPAPATPATPAADTVDPTKIVAKETAKEASKEPAEAKAPVMTMADVKARFDVDSKAAFDALRAAGLGLTPEERATLEDTFEADDLRADGYALASLAMLATDKNPLTALAKPLLAKLTIDLRDKIFVQRGEAKAKLADALMVSAQALAVDPKKENAAATESAFIALVKDTDVAGYSAKTFEEDSAPLADFNGKLVKVALGNDFRLSTQKAEHGDAAGKLSSYQGYLARVIDKDAAKAAGLGGEYPIVYVLEKA